MSKRNVFSSIVFILSVLFAVICYAVVTKKYDKIWFEFTPIFLICVITFVAGIGMFIGAVLLERDEKN